jgi:fructokinase
LGLSHQWLQIDSEHETGAVDVSIATGGQPQFHFKDAVAWDFLEWTPQWDTLAHRADAVCFGSLAQRSTVSRETIRKFLGALKPNALKVFDVNLRQNFFSADVLRESAKVAGIMKVNHEELPRVAEMLGHKAAGQKPAEWLMKEFRLKLLCVTQGAGGSALFTRSGVHRHPGFAIKVADTVGAGDAFTAALVHHYLRKATPDAMNEAANRMGSWVASQVGATPKPNVTFIKSVRHASARPLD